MKLLGWAKNLPEKILMKFIDVSVIVEAIGGFLVAKSAEVGAEIVGQYIKNWIDRIGLRTATEAEAADVKIKFDALLATPEATDLGKAIVKLFK